MPLELFNVSKSYGGTRVLQNFSKIFPDKGIVYITGRSGAGKTTLLRLIAGLEKPDSGKITGAEDSKITMVFQEDRLLKEQTVLDNIMAVSDAGRAHKYIELTGLSGWEKAFINQLSGGMARRVAVARALAYGGDIYLMDEPFKGIDEITLQPILSQIEQIAKNRLILMSVHDLPPLPGEKIEL